MKDSLLLLPREIKTSSIHRNLQTWPLKLTAKPKTLKEIATSCKTLHLFSFLNTTIQQQYMKKLLTVNSAHTDLKLMDFYFLNNSCNRGKWRFDSFCQFLHEGYGTTETRYLWQNIAGDPTIHQFKQWANVRKSYHGETPESEVL